MRKVPIDSSADQFHPILRDHFFDVVIPLHELPERLRNRLKLIDLAHVEELLFRRDVWRLQFLLHQ